MRAPIVTVFMAASSTRQMLTFNNNVNKNLTVQQ